MNDKKICFIVCTNNELLFNECMAYISRLYVPEGYETDALAVTDAKSMTSGYNEGMRSTDAKYKVYLHQDVFIINRYFIYDLLKIFSSSEKIGMVGMIGYPEMAGDAVMWHAESVGAIPMFGAAGVYKDVNLKDYRYRFEDGLTEVQVADGLLMATSQDVEWDEEFDGWDFYDASQCIRFINAGWKVVVPTQKVPWFVHDDGIYLAVFNYNKYRKKFIEKYMPDRKF